MYGFTSITPGKITADVVATDTLLANEARLADWIVRGGKITSQGQTDGIPWAELDGATGLIKFIKGAVSAYFGIENGFPSFRLVNGNNTLEIYKSQESLGLRLTDGQNNRIDLVIDQYLSSFDFYYNGLNVLELGYGGVGIYRTGMAIKK